MPVNALSMDRCDVEQMGERLVAIRLAVPEISPDERAAFGPKMKDVVTRIVRAGKRFVVAADMRGPTVISPDTTAYIIEIMKADNPALERSGLLISQSATLGLQVDRAINAADATRRKRFYEREAFEKWLGEVLKVNEQQLLAEFLRSAKG